MEFAGGGPRRRRRTGRVLALLLDAATRAVLALLVVLAVPVVYAAALFGARTVTWRRVRDALVTVVDADPDEGTPSDVRLP